MKRLGLLLMVLFFSSFVFADANHLMDRSGKGNNLTQYGTPTYAEGELLLNGTTGMYVRSNINPKTLQNWTIIVSFKRYFSVNVVNYTELINSEWNPRFSTNANSPSSFSSGNSFRNNSPNANWVYPGGFGSGLTHGTRYTFAGAYNSQNFNYLRYRDTTNVGSGTITGGMNLSYGNWNYYVIGASPSVPDYLNGSIYEVLIINATYNASQIVDTYNGKYAYPDKILGWYPFSGQGDSCFPSLGAHWTVQGSQNCNLSRNFDLGGYNLTINGTGVTTITANITGCRNLVIQGNATVVLMNKAVLPCSK